ncbi:glycosyltransferase family 2 protein [Aeromonas media]|uniref:glycosyltransferase family 2 protein n=1 Tax=Aeromonas media TaxID=651 RepID=UPI003D1F98CD
MISILTPTYNRAHTLERLFDSLKNQSDYDFEWIIVDDGSSDETKSVINSFQQNCDFNIIYCYQENAGKPQALNQGIKLCNTDYIFIVDSDDALMCDAISSIKESVELSLTDNQDFSGVGFRRSYFDGNIIGKDTSGKNSSILYLHSSEAGDIFCGDLAYCFKKKYLEKYPFPKIENEKFVPELYIWNKITDEAKVRFNINKSIYLCEYLEDGLSHNFYSQLRKNPKGFKLFYIDQFKREKLSLKKIKMLIRVIQCNLNEMLS